MVLPDDTVRMGGMALFHLKCFWVFATWNDEECGGVITYLLCWLVFGWLVSNNC